MLPEKIINSIYKKYHRHPASADELDIPLLFEKVPEEFGVEVTPEAIVIGCVDRNSPFREIPLGNVNAIVDFSEHVAIVLRASIIFLSKMEGGNVSVHLKNIGPTFLDRVRAAFAVAM